MANKIGSLLAHSAALGAVTACFISDELDFIKTMLVAIFAEIMAIYFNTNK